MSLFTSPPVAYAQVYPGIYRCSHPSPSAYPFLSNLNLKSLVCVDGEIKAELKEFCQQNEILLVQKDVGHNQEPFVVMDSEIMNGVLRICLGMTK
jgi:hypothetical protein